MIIGLLNLYGSPAIQQLVLQELTSSGLLTATDALYYAHVPAPHPKSARVSEELALFQCAKQYPDAYVWSVNVKDFSKGTSSDIDWCTYELYFLVRNWRRAVATLEAGYDSYGVNLHSAPEPHYTGYCFWMKGSSMSLLTLPQPYCAFHSFTNHYSSRFVPEEYQDCDWEQPAPLSSRRLQQALFRLPPEQQSLGTLMLLLFYHKHHFEPIAYHKATRPHVIIDVPDVGSLITGATGLGRIDYISIDTSVTQAIIGWWTASGWTSDFNVCEELVHGTADIIYTSSERVEYWLPVLAGQGVIVVQGTWRGQLPCTTIGEYTIIAREASALLLR